MKLLPASADAAGIEAASGPMIHVDYERITSHLCKFRIIHLYSQHNAMKKYIFLIVITILSAAGESCAQNSRKVKQKPVRNRTAKVMVQKQQDSLTFLPFTIDKNGDTVYIDELEQVTVVADRKGREWRKYYRLVHNFAKTFPYALLAEEKLLEADSTITADELRRGKTQPVH